MSAVSFDKNVNYLANPESDNQFFHSLQIKCPHRFKVFFVEFTFEEITYMKSHIKSTEGLTEIVTSGQVADCNLSPATAMFIRHTGEDQWLSIDCHEWDSKETKMPKEIEMQTEIGGSNGEFMICPWPYILTRVIKIITSKIF